MKFYQLQGFFIESSYERKITFGEVE